MEYKDEKTLMNAFIRDLEKMKPLWTAWPLMLTPGLNIRRETEELISMTWWGEDDWSVMVFFSLGPGPRYRDREYNNLTLEEAIGTVLGNLKAINARANFLAREKAGLVVMA